MVNNVFFMIFIDIQEYDAKLVQFSKLKSFNHDF